MKYLPNSNNRQIVLDKREKFSTKFALIFKLIVCTHYTKLPQVQYNKLPESNEKFNECNH